jgi:hypothetical protein
MRKMMRSACFGLLLAGTIPALPNQYWVAWEGEDFPENQGWTRHWGNWSGPYQGTGAQRTLENGTLTYDTSYDAGVYDYADMQRQIDPGPGEQFVMEWRLKVDEVTGWYADPGVAVAGDDGWIVGLLFGENQVVSVFENCAATPFVPNVFHDFRLTSSDMRTYDLFIDERLARTGSFWQGLTYSGVSWGDATQGAASLSEWEHFRVGVVPEPAAGTLVGAVIACCGRRRG